MTDVRAVPLDLERREGWSDITRTDPPDRRVIAVVVTTAVLADLAARSGIACVAGALAVLAVTGGTLATGRIRNRAAVPLVAAAGLFGTFLMVRSSPWVVFLDLVAALGLLALGASLAKQGDPADLSVPNLLGRVVHAAGHGVLAPAFPFSGRRDAARRGSPSTSTSWAGVARGLALAAPVVMLVGGLLASADAVFASFFRMPADAGDLVWHGFLMIVGAWFTSGVLRMASGDAFALPRTVWRPLGTTEATTVLVSLAALFSVFAAAQISVVVGGAAYVERTAGLTYAEHARSGFFQLLAVAAISLGVILTTRAATSEDAARVRLILLTEVVVVLTLVVVAVAIRRLFLYEAAYGLTLLRLWSVLFAVWIGVVFVLAAVAVAGFGAPRRWLSPAAALVGLAMLAAANVVNVEQFLVERNVERFAGTERVDVAHLLSLSDDAVPAIVDALGSMRPADADVARSVLCREPEKGGLWSWNLARSAADDSRRSLCEPRG